MRLLCVSCISYSRVFRFNSVLFLMFFFLHHHIIFLFSSKTDNYQSISGIISKENKNRVYFMIKKTQRPK